MSTGAQALEERLRSFESKYRAGSAIWRKALEEAEASLDINLEPQITQPPSNPPSGEALGHSPATQSSVIFDGRQHHKFSGDSLQAASSASGLTGLRSASTYLLRRRLHARGRVQRPDKGQQRGQTPHHAANFTQYGCHDSANLHDSESSGDVVYHDGGNGDVGKGVQAATKEDASAVAVSDLAAVGGLVYVPSPIEQVLARRKRRRRVNISVSSALLLSASAEDIMLPAAQATRSVSPLTTLEAKERCSNVGCGDELERLYTRCVSSASSESRSSQLCIEIPRARVYAAADSERLSEELPEDTIPTVSRTALQAHDDDDLTQRAPTVLLGTPTFSEVGCDEAISHVADGESQCKRTWRHGAVGEDTFVKPHNPAHETSASASRSRCANSKEKLDTANEDPKLSWDEICTGSEEIKKLDQVQPDNAPSDEESPTRKWWKQGPETESSHATLCASDPVAELTPSPLPSPPMPLNPTLRESSSVLYHLPPSIVPPTSDRIILQDVKDSLVPNNLAGRDEPHMVNIKNEGIPKTPTSGEHLESDMEKVFPPPVGDESIMVSANNEETARTPAMAALLESDANNARPPPERPFSGKSARDSNVGEGCDAEETLPVSCRGTCYAGRSCRRWQKKMRETISSGIKGEPNRHAGSLHKPEAGNISISSRSASPVNTKTISRNHPKVELDKSPGAHSIHPPPRAHGSLGRESVRHRAQHILDLPVAEPSRADASDRMGSKLHHPPLPQGQCLKTPTSAVLVLQRWARRVIKSSKLETPEGDVPAQKKLERLLKGVNGSESLGGSSSAMLCGSSVSLAVPTKGTSQPSSGANANVGATEISTRDLPSRQRIPRRSLKSDTEVSSVMPGKGHSSIDVRLEASKARGKSDVSQRHLFPQGHDSNLKNSNARFADRDCVDRTGLQTSRNDGRDLELPDHCRKAKLTFDVSTASPPPWTLDSRQDSDTRSPDPVATLRNAGVNELPGTGLLSSSLFSCAIQRRPIRSVWADSVYSTPVSTCIQRTGHYKVDLDLGDRSRGCSRDPAFRRNHSGCSKVGWRFASSLSCDSSQDQPNRKLSFNSVGAWHVGIPPEKSSFEKGTGYGVTSPITCFDRYHRISRRIGAKHAGQGFSANESEPYSPKDDASTAEVSPGFPFLQSRQEHVRAVRVVEPLSNYSVAITTRGLSTNPLLNAWDVTNPLLTAAAATKASDRIMSGQGVAPHS